MFDSLDGVDWELLHRQKLVLLGVLDGIARDSATAEALWGLVHLLDALQDDAAAAGRWAFPGESVAVAVTEPAPPKRYYVEDDDGHHYRYSRRARQRTLKTRLGNQWRWGAFCKTQYASAHGLPHFLRCHLLVIAVLDRARELGLLRRVSDEGGYWRSRRLDTLSRSLGQYNLLIGAFAKLLKEAAPPGHRVESEIEQHPDYEQFTIEQLAADFPEMHAAVARTARLMKAAARLPAPAVTESA